MSKNIDWVFERRGSKESAVGDYIPGKILQSRKLNEISVYAREGGQNTKNQPIKEDQAVNVEVKLIELTGNHLQEYLKNLQWDELKQHIQACAKVRTSSPFSIKLKNSLEEITNNKSLFILNIEDSNSKGLTGAEANDDGESVSNFYNLCKATFFTPGDAKSSRGGSYGVGKSIFWNSSKISTVIFSSRVNETDQNPNGLRIYGRCELASHKVTNFNYTGSGFFGKPSKEKEGTYVYEAAESLWDNNDLAKKLYVDRDIKKGTGATISVVGLKDDFYEDGHEGHEILKGIKEQFEKFFWPSIALFPKKLNLSFKYQRNSKIRDDFDEDLELDLSKWQHFIDAANANEKNVVKIANKANSLSLRNLSLKVPPRKIKIDEIKEKLKKETIAPFQLSIKRGDKNDQWHEEKDKIALIRGFGMVVEYYRPSTSSISSSLPYFGVVKVGKTLGSSNENIISEVLFKDLEPELHDRWDSKTKGLETKYNKVKTAVDEFYENIDENLLQILGEEEIESNKGPEILAKMLNLGFKGKKENDSIISSENIKATIQDKYKWSVSGTIKISDFPKSKDKSHKRNWQVGFGFSIKEETSRGDRIPFSKISFNEIDNVRLLDSKNVTKVEVTEIKNFSFQGEIDLEKIVGSQDSKYLAINFFTGN